MATDYETIAAKLWPRIEDNKSRWELRGVGLNDGYSKMIVDDIIIALNEALKMSRPSAFNAGTACLGRLIPCEQSVAYDVVRTPTAEIVG